MKIEGILRPGYQVASGTSKRDTRFSPQGALRMQAPFFLMGGLDLEAYFEGKIFWGTLNFDIYPLQYEHVKTDYYFPQVHWTTLQPAENFLLSHAKLEHMGNTYKALVFTPDPATKPNHFEPPNIIEFIAEWIPGVNYGDTMMLDLQDDHIKLSPFEGERPAPLKDTAR